MRFAPNIKSAGLGILALAMTGAVATAQEAAKAALPDTVACPESIAAIATCYGAKRRVSNHVGSQASLTGQHWVNPGNELVARSKAIASRRNCGIFKRLDERTAEEP